ncbi:MAG: amidohydrolase family protein [Planctomycetes bacterium]|nr:amidohydrolase family protein [Planctomycetota bacterium]
MKQKHVYRSSLWLAGIALVPPLANLPSALASPEVPGAKQTRPIALVGGTIHTLEGPDIASGTVLFDKGKIVAVGKQVKIPANALKVDVTGKHVYPGLIESYSNTGLIEIGAVRATRDSAETGSINPNVKAQVAVNPDSELIPVGRANGVLLSMSVPRGGLISGQSALLQLDGWTWEDLTLRSPVGMHVRWPRMDPISAWWMKETKKDQLAERDEALANLRKALGDARAYAKARAADPQRPIDSRWEAMLPVLAGKLPLIVEAEEIQQIQSAVAFAAKQKLKLIIYGGYDAPHCAALLKKHEVPVIVGGVHRLPRRRHEPYDTPFTVPARLHKAGVRFCISGSGRFGASTLRNLPYQAAMAAAHGLPEDEALKSITLYAAEILGAGDRVGSLAAGKDATLFVADGDILEIPTHVTAAYIQGRVVDLSNRHTRLYQKYQQRYRRQRVKK